MGLAWGFSVTMVLHGLDFSVLGLGEFGETIVLNHCFSVIRSPGVSGCVNGFPVLRVSVVLIPNASNRSKARWCQVFGQK